MQIDVGGILAKEDHRRKSMPLRLTFFPWHPLMIFHEGAGLITALTAEVFKHMCHTFLLSSRRIGLFSVRRAVVQDLFRIHNKYIYRHLSWSNVNILRPPLFETYVDLSINLLLQFRVLCFLRKKDPFSYWSKL